MYSSWTSEKKFLMPSSLREVCRRSRRISINRGQHSDHASQLGIDSD